MKGHFRIWLAVLGGLLLSLPLIGLIYALLVGIPAGTIHTPDPLLVPMLSDAERTGTLTYQRKCHTDSDCDPRLRCLFSMVLGYSFCVDSRCMTDKECPEAYTCQTYIAENRKDLINACTLAGARKEGEVCEMFTRTREYGCERGLSCHARCGRPCEPDEPAACPEGFYCEKSRRGAACQPTCAGRACPEGQRCIALAGRSSVCAKVHGQDCQSTPCSPDKTCSVRDYPQSAHEVWMRCVQTCNLAGKAPCPEGTACVVHSCRKTCTPDDATACGEGYRCESRPDLPAICVADVQEVPPVP